MGDRDGSDGMSNTSCNRSEGNDHDDDGLDGDHTSQVI